MPLNVLSVFIYPADTERNQWKQAILATDFDGFKDIFLIKLSSFVLWGIFTFTVSF